MCPAHIPARTAAWGGGAGSLLRGRILAGLDGCRRLPGGLLPGGLLLAQIVQLTLGQHSLLFLLLLLMLLVLMAQLSNQPLHIQMEEQYGAANQRQYADDYTTHNAQRFP